MNEIMAQAGLQDIHEKVAAGERLDVEDGVRLFETPNLAAVGMLANVLRERLNGNRAFYVYNQHVNYSNICINGCRFCAFRRKEGQEGAYRMTVDEVATKLRERADEPIREVHIVGGCDPDLPYDYYLDMLRAVREARPDIHIQAFTCVEIAHIATVAGKSVEEVLADLKEAGLGSIPGGGAEVFSKRIRESLCREKLSPKGWLDVAKCAHRMGIRSNATMLYGHEESYRDRAEHLDMLRKAQDETGGFMSFIPLAFHPKNTELENLPGTTGVDDLKNIAVARLMLDNFPHIKAFWIMIGPKLAQISLSFGADDMDGTVIEEKITHMAGASTDQVFPVNKLRRYIREAGRDPVERDTVYNIIQEG
jgi:aminodeoxyfutalosine synthase